MMELSERDKKRIGTLHPELQRLCHLHLEECRRRNVWFRVTQAFRAYEDQYALWRQGRDEGGAVVDPSKIVTHAPPGRSWHEYGLAYDVVLLRPSGEISWDLAEDGDLDGVKDWWEIGAAGEAVGLTWGGRWKKIKDYPHFEYHPNLDILAAWNLSVRHGRIPPGQFSGGVA